MKTPSVICFALFALTKFFRMGDGASGEYWCLRWMHGSFGPQKEMVFRCGAVGTEQELFANGSGAR